MKENENDKINVHVFFWLVPLMKTKMYVKHILVSAFRV